MLSVFFADTNDIVQVIRSKGGPGFVRPSKNGPEGMNNGLENLAKNFNKVFSDYMNNDNPNMQNVDFNHISPKLLMGTLLVALLAMQRSSNTAKVDPHLIATLQSEIHSRFLHQDVLTLGSKGDSVVEFKKWFSKLVSPEELRQYVEELRKSGKSNPITQEPYTFDDSPQSVVQASFAGDLYDRKTEIGVIAAQTHWGIRPDGDVERETRGEIDKRLPGTNANQAMQAVIEELKAKNFQLTEPEIKAVIPKLFAEAPKDFKESLINLFLAHARYFLDSNQLRQFVRRFAKFHKFIYYQIGSTKVIPASNNYLSHVVFLMIARGTIKDLVWQYGADSRAKIRKLGGNPSLVYNLYDFEQVGKIFKFLIDQGLLKDELLNDLLERDTGYNLKSFRTNAELMEIFADQVASILIDALDSRIVNLPDNHPKKELLKALRDQLEKMGSYDKERFLLTSRNLYFLKGGDRAGDCTKAGAMNYWTEGTWNAAFDNQEFEIYHDKEFFARFISMVGESNGTLALWVHAVEFTPLARPEVSSSSGSKFRNQQLQKELLLKSFQFLADFAKRAGVKNVYVTGISNSFGFVNLLGPILSTLSDQDVKVTLEPRTFTLLNGLNSAHSLKEYVMGTSSEAAESIYLQGWRGQANFVRTHETAEVEKPEEVNQNLFAGQPINQDDLERGAPILMQMIEDNLRNVEKTVGQLSNMKFERSNADSFDKFAFDVARAKDPERKLKKEMDNIWDYSLRLARLYDPGAEENLTVEWQALQRYIESNKEYFIRNNRDALRIVNGLFDELQEMFESKAKRVKRKEREVRWERTDREEGGLLRGLNVSLDKWVRRTGGALNVWIYDISKALNIHVRSSETIGLWLINSQPSEELLELDYSEYVRQYKEKFLQLASTEGYIAALNATTRELRNQPQEAREFHSRIDVLMHNLENLTQQQPESVMEVITHIVPQLLKEFEKNLRSVPGNYEEKSIELMLSHPEEVVRYYQERSKEGTNKKAGALSSQVSTFTLNTIMAMTCPY